jgi:RHS repeat-associated protein
MTNSRSQTTTYTFERIQGRLKVTDVSGPGCPTCGASSETTYGYDDDQRLVSITDGEGNLTEYLDHDSRGQPRTVVEASGSPAERTISYQYHPDLPGVLLSRSPESVLHPSDPADPATVYDYDDPDAPGDDPNVANEAPSPLLHRDIRLGWRRTYTTDQLVATKYITSYQYNDYGQVTQIDGPRGDVADVTGFTYDPVTGDLLTKTEPLAGTTTYSNYDDNGNVGSVTDVNGNVTHYTYDQRNRIATVTQAGAGPSGQNLVTSYFYEQITGRLDYLRLPKGNYVDYAYDEAGRIERIVKTATQPQPGATSQGETIRYEYDTEGNRLREEHIDPQGAVVKFTDFRYDAYNRLEKEFNPEYGDPATNPYYKLYGYDDAGFRTSVTDERGHQTEYVADSLGRLIQVTHHFQNADGSVTDDYVTDYGYDLHDNLTSIADANDNLTTHQHDDFGNLLDATSPDTGLTKYRYFGVNLLRKKTLADGTVIEYFYDAQNRLTLADFPDDSKNITYNYDEPGSANGMGRLTSMEDPSGTTVFHYNALGKVTREVKTIDGEDYEVGYGYDTNGSLVTLTYPDGRVVTFGIDNYDRPKAITQALNGYESDVVTQAAHLPNGPVDLLDLPGAVPSWDPEYGVRYQMETLSAGGVLDRTYGFDFSGNIESIADNLTPSKSMSFGYDSLSRLEEADGPWGTGGGYTYDPVGNRLTKNIGAETSYTLVPGTNKLATATGAEPAVFSYDANGNMTGDGTLTYVYSENQRLIQVVDGATPVGDYVYDGEGKRAKKTAGGVTTVFIYDRAGNTLAEIAKEQGPGGADVHQDYVWLDNLRVAMVVGEVGDTCIDNDGDGFGDPASPACTYPYEDCDDITSDDPPICSSCTCGSPDCAPCARCINTHPSTVEFAGDGIDSNCDGQDDPQGGCFIATVAFGSPLAGQVETFRAFRDRYLRTNRPGSLLVGFYESHGPRAAHFIGERDRLKSLVRGVLYPVAAVCAFALEATVWQKAAVTVVTLLVPFGMIFLVSRLRGKGILEYKKALCVLLAAVFAFDTVMLGYFGAGGGVKEVHAAVPDGIYFYLNDHLGTPLKMVDEDGTVVWSADYLTFGQATVDPASTIESNWRFPGQFWDVESGLHYNLMRFYAPKLGRYTSPDPVNSATVQLPESLRHIFATEASLEAFKYSPELQNLYPYVVNNPYGSSDATGEFGYLAFVRLIPYLLIALELYSCLIFFSQVSAEYARIGEQCKTEYKCEGQGFLEKYGGNPSVAILNCMEEREPGIHDKLSTAAKACAFRLM